MGKTIPVELISTTSSFMSSISQASLDSSFVIIDGEELPITQLKDAEKINELVRIPCVRHGSSQLTILHQLTHPSQDPSYAPGSTPSYAHDWSERSTGGVIKIDGRNLVDAYGRVCSLRGVNMSGSSKTCVSNERKSYSYEASV